MKSGAFTVGDMALFTTYVGQVARSGSLLGTILTNHKRAEVSYFRMAYTIEDIPRERISQHTDVYLNAEPDKLVLSDRSESDRLNALTVRNMTYIYPQIYKWCLRY